ncbi:MAG: ParB/RepB/Spo0J family partition protein [Lachnospirales bacterium]
MSKEKTKIRLSPIAELINLDENTSTVDDNLEKVVEIPIDNLIEFSNHPFKVIDNNEMSDLKESIDKYGILMPLIARPKDNGNYEIIAGHRRKYACGLLGKESIPTLVRDLDDEEATIIMVDSNLQRENLLYSEKAFAFKLKLEAIKKQAGRPKNNCSQVGNNSKRSLEIVAEEANES